jgi:hypothetical protein
MWCGPMNENDQVFESAGLKTDSLDGFWSLKTEYNLRLMNAEVA